LLDIADRDDVAAPREPAAGIDDEIRWTARLVDEEAVDPAEVFTGGVADLAVAILDVGGKIVESDSRVPLRSLGQRPTRMPVARTRRPAAS